MSYPSNLKYTREHEWVNVHGDGTATIGITYFAQSELGDIVFVELPQPGSVLAKDSVFGTVEAVKTVSELFAPVSGTVTELNSELDGNPEAVNEDPYGKGWMIKVSLSKPDEINDLMDAAAYQSIIS